MWCIKRLQIIQAYKGIGTKANKAQQKVQELASSEAREYSSKISSQASTDPESLEIPASTFQNIKKELARGCSDYRIPKWRREENEKLSDTQKKIIEKLIEPPAYPITTDEI